MRNDWRKRKQRVFELVEVGYAGDFYSRAYDFIGVVAIIVNLAVSVLDTYDNIHAQYGALLSALETATVLFFTADYALRVWTADQLYPDNPSPVRKYVFSMTGLIDLLCFLPWYLPVFFPSGAVAFRMFRVVRIFRLFRINTYYDSLNVITEVISGKRQQLFSSLFILCVLMLGASLCMYSIEHDAQPDVFSNAFSGIWWAASTLLTVGYGDIYPMTPAGRLFGICITFLGVGIVAIPTGIISAGFVEQYSKIKRLSEIAEETDIRFIKLQLGRKDAWTGKSVKDLGLPHGVILAAIRRGKEVIVPRGNVALREGDTIILGAEPLRDDQHIDFQEVTLRRQHPWNGKAIRDLDISRHTLIVTVRRGNKALIPNGDLVLKEADTVTLYTQIPMSDAEKVRI
ncbi:MAG: ion transporter [Oscillospiraceae bacterium]|nr:ion transporter [Oscillospiraceae bacterium]